MLLLLSAYRLVTALNVSQSTECSYRTVTDRTMFVKSTNSPSTSNMAKTSHMIFHHSIRMIAAALVLDSCPPDTHCGLVHPALAAFTVLLPDFSAYTVFNYFSYKPCFAAIGRHAPFPTTRNNFIHQLEDESEVQSTSTAIP